MSLQVYTDGSCQPNPGIGGWGWVHFWENKDPLVLFSDSGGPSCKTTQNRMELLAVLEFIKSFLDRPFRCREIHIYSDSQYVVYTIGEGILSLCFLKARVKYTGYAKNWVFGSTGVRKESGAAKNEDLWLELNKILLEILNRGKERIYFHWVRGHSGNWGNSIADKLAKQAVKKLKKST